jgi:hypothetical protein
MLLATMVIDLTGLDSRIVHRPRPENDPRQRRPDISRAQNLLDWSHSLCLKTASYISYCPTRNCEPSLLRILSFSKTAISGSTASPAGRETNTQRFSSCIDWHSHA